VQLLGQEPLDLTYDMLGIIDPRQMTSPGYMNDTKIRVRGRDRVSVPRRSKGVAFAPHEKGRHVQCLPPFTDHEMTSETAGITHAAQKTEVTVQVPTLTRNVGVE
jgi:hypothetical protein